MECLTFADPNRPLLLLLLLLLLHLPSVVGAGVRVCVNLDMQGGSSESWGAIIRQRVSPLLAAHLCLPLPFLSHLSLATSSPLKPFLAFPALHLSIGARPVASPSLTSPSPHLHPRHSSPESWRRLLCSTYTRHGISSTATTTSPLTKTSR